MTRSTEEAEQSPTERKVAPTMGAAIRRTGRRALTKSAAAVNTTKATDREPTMLCDPTGAPVL